MAFIIFVSSFVFIAQNIEMQAMSLGQPIHPLSLMPAMNMWLQYTETMKFAIF